MQHSPDSYKGSALASPRNAWPSPVRLVADTRPTLFKLTYNRTKLKTRSPKQRHEYEQRITLWGTDYPQGDFPRIVTLQTGDVFDSIDELRSFYDKIGAYTIEEV